MVSRPFVASIFKCLPKNVHFVGLNPRQYSGLPGLHKLFRELKALRPTVVCDLHDVLRTKYLRLGFMQSGIPVSHIHKDRKARKNFLHQQPKQQQETSFERYATALEKIGYPIKLDASLPSIFERTEGRASCGVGIAPFAAHKGKIYPLEKMEQVVRLLSERGASVYLFGAGAEEKAVTEAWAEKYSNVESMVGKLSDMAEEARFMSGLKVMLTMDSGNMHLASLTGTPVVSIWGATHPLGGFLGWGQKMENAIQKTDMPCRPCSIFGNKPCRLGDYPCLSGISPETIVNKVLEICR